MVEEIMEVETTGSNEPSVAALTNEPSPSNIEAIQPENDDDDLIISSNNNGLDVTSREEIAIAGSQEPDVDHTFTEEAPVPVNSVVGGEISEIDTADSDEKTVPPATLDNLGSVEDVTSIINESKDDNNLDPPEPLDGAATRIIETVTWDDSVCDHEAELEVVMDAGLVGCDLDGDIVTVTPPVGDESDVTLPIGDGISSGDAPVLETELPISPTGGTVEPTMLSSSSSSQVGATSNGSPLKIPFRTTTFVDQKQRKQPQQQQPHMQQPSSSSEPVPPSLVLTLPIDSLHSIASFLSPIEWTHFGRCSKGTNKISNEIFRKVRMHGFRCATEVVTAWKLRQHADAKELCALYVQAGVPIYPSCLGHSYHTLVWRLGVEAKHLEEQRNAAMEESATSTPPSSPPSENPADEGTTNGTGRLASSAPATNATATGGNDGESVIPPEVDPFYRHREDNRARTEGFVPDAGSGHGGGLSYLEEKALFVTKAKEEESDGDQLSGSIRRQMSLSHHSFRLPAGRGGAHQHHRSMNGVSLRQFQTEALNRMGFRLGGSSEVTGHDGGTRNLNRTPIARSSSFTDLRFRPPKVVIKVHRHLLDQHLLGRQSVNDHEGAMITPPVSLSADFFHPYFSFRSAPTTSHQAKPNGQSSASTFAANDGPGLRHLVPEWNHPISFPAAAVGVPSSATGNDPRMHHLNMADPVEEEGDASIGLSRQAGSEGLAITYDSDSDAEANAGPVYRPGLIDGTRGMAADDHHSIHPPPLLIPLRPPGTSFSAMLSTSSASERGMGQSFAFQSNLLSNVDLDVYSASSSNAKVEDDDAIGNKVRSHLKTRFAVYHRRLEKHLANNDSASFEECVLDFWDEFLPQTAYIQYYDKHTAVPRVSCMHKFLTRPCPKAVGTIQCQIERIKVGSKKKGVSMKGRFFPTYEYRLFIRHHPSDPASESSNESNNSKTPRRDTVLMIAKNRGRKHLEIPGQAPVTSMSKKGSNNYYLYLPQQDDVDVHHASVNSSEHTVTGPIPNGLGICGFKQDTNALLGRLQSNFIGTEFQIYTPRTVKLKPKPLNARSITVPSNLSPGASSDEDVPYEIGPANAEVSCTSARRRNRFGRLSMRSRGTNDPRSMDEGPALLPIDPDSALMLRRSRSSGDVVTPGRKSRPSRRVSAADALQNHQTILPQPTMYEEEDGAITYTANLLGSRPRIMDVCVPKVGSDGMGMEWKRYIENSEDVDAASSPNRMLNHLKTLQQRIDGEEGGRLAGPGINSEARDSDDGYSPPDDFGLLVLQNRPPWWNVELGSFVLNFGGRVSVASVKNFQLCDRTDQDYVMLQFGRIQGRHSFTMDFQYPLTAVQAFAIAISSLQSKISFG